MSYVRVLFDIASYRSEAGHMDSATKGEVVEISDDEAKRLIDMGAAEKATAKDAKDAADAAEAAAKPASPDNLKTPAGVDAGDGKHDVDA